MSVDPVKFVINKKVDTTFTFTIKQTGSTSPMVITNGDTFNYKLIDLFTDEVKLSGGIAVKDAANGEITLTITSSQADTLASSKGDVCDGMYLKPTYRLLVDCHTANNGNFIAKVPKVYVE